VQIRVAEPHEYAAAGELTARVYTEEGFVRPGSPYLAELADAAARADKAELLVAVTDPGRRGWLGDLRERRHRVCGDRRGG